MTTFASGVAQDKKIRVRALGRGSLLKSKLHSPPQAERNWKPINAFDTHFGRQMRAAHSIYTRTGSKHRDNRMGNWNVTSLNGKEEN